MDWELVKSGTIGLVTVEMMRVELCCNEGDGVVDGEFNVMVS